MKWEHISIVFTQLGWHLAPRSYLSCFLNQIWFRRVLLLQMIAYIKALSSHIKAPLGQILVCVKSLILNCFSLSFRLEPTWPSKLCTAIGSLSSGILHMLTFLCLPKPINTSYISLKKAMVKKFNIILYFLLMFILVVLLNNCSKNYQAICWLQVINMTSNTLTKMTWHLLV